MDVIIWGSRGSIAVSGDRYRDFGGDTTCVELRHAGERLILDGGTGLRPLGAACGGPIEATILFSHLHWDHIQGVPFFGPAYHPESRITMAAARREGGGVRASLAAQMQPIRFPVGIEALAGIEAFEDLDPAEIGRTALHIGPFRVLGQDLDHPDGVIAWRVEAEGTTVVFATDVEHGPGAVDERLVHFAEGADLLLHDAQYTAAEYRGDDGGPPRRGWGHSTVEQATEVAERAGVGALGLVHHDPARDDASLRDLEHAARARFAGAFAAREGARLAL